MHVSDGIHGPRGIELGLKTYMCTVCTHYKNVPLLVHRVRIVTVA